MAVLTRSAVARAGAPTPTLSLDDDSVATSQRGRTPRQQVAAAPTGMSPALMSSPLSTMAAASSGTMNTPIRPRTDNTGNQANQPPASPTMCVICLSDMSGTRQAEIPVCHHVFCYECIREWSQVENSCPLCKVRFTSLASVEGRNSNNEDHANGRSGEVLESVAPRNQGASGGSIQIQILTLQLLAAVLASSPPAGRPRAPHPDGRPPTPRPHQRAMVRRPLSPTSTEAFFLSLIRIPRGGTASSNGLVAPSTSTARNEDGEPSIP